MRHGSLFSGIGGFDLAASWMGWENVFQVEFDPWCQKVLAKNFPNALRFGDIVEFNKMLQDGRITTDTEGAGLLREKELENNSENNGTRRGCNSPDLHKIYRENGEITTHSGCTAKQVTNKGTMGCEDAETERERGIGVLNSITHPSLRDGQIYIGHIDIITGGFPCQPFSHAGKRKGVADERYLWPEMLTTIRIFKPSFVVGENVAGLVSMENGKTLDSILADLENEGYQVESFIIPACAVGAWHRRDRIWIIAHLHGAGFKQGYQKNEGRPSEQFNGNSIQHLTTYVNYQGLQGGLPGREFNPEGRQEPKNGRTTQCSAGGQWNGQIQWATEPPMGGVVTGLSLELDGYWDREPEGIPRVATGVKNRVDRLKGLGNAIVPQIALQLFKAIAEYKNI